ncbi:uncharacterized protein TM35_000083170 [Trypanosoma theileri]|uniref:Uncharacterized protein n=1 Tax=Trypanosoma theileri TaxID=67003 RepID=A0A1X0P1W2_9TRYP|nr:uncharacterized protein TM35_000083170 [Trypanosoma theileri]ORC90519.1 hypothetical protein TM35_000083170 [Trypanosoma theileri]
MSVEARLYHAEQQVDQLNQQVKLLKQLVTTEVHELHQFMEQQVAEVKEAVMHQDKIYQERMNKLEIRIHQLSEFCLHLASSSGYTGSTRGIIPFNGVSLSSSDHGTVKQETTIANMNTSSLDGNNDEDNSNTKTVDGILNKYKNRIDAIYDFYTASAIDVFHPTMTISHFSHFVKDCQLCGLSQGTSAELLWIAVMRSLNAKQSKNLTEKKNQNRDIRQGSSSSSSSSSSKIQNKDLFVYQRLETIPKNLFGEALYILAKEKYRQKRSSEVTTLSGLANVSTLDEKPEETFLTFLLYHIFPYVDSVMEEKQRQDNLSSYSVINHDVEKVDFSTSLENDIIQEYKTDTVKAVVKEFMGRIKECFSSAIKTAQGYHCTVMNLDGFVEVARRYELLPLIRKSHLRQIFLSCSELEREKHPEAEEGTISVGTFLLALYYLADGIYGDSLMRKQFPTPEARVKKLLTKMFFLN